MSIRPATPILLGFTLLLGFMHANFSSAGSGNRHQDRGSRLEQLLDEHADQLGLDAETRAAIQTITDQTRQENASLRDELHQAHGTMRTLLTSETPNEAAVMQQAETIGRLEIAQQKNRLRALLHIRALLTPDQRQTLIHLHEVAHTRRQTAIQTACRDELDHFCADVTPGWEQMRCLRLREDDLSSACSDTLFSHRPSSGARVGER